MDCEHTGNWRDQELEGRLHVIGAHFDLDRLLDGKKDNQAVAKYYRKSDFFYGWIHHRGGDAIHMGLSKDGFHKPDDFLNQARFVESLLLQPSMQILELGAGKLFNTRYLARKYPQHQFTALDLPNRRFLKKRVPANVTLREGDYHDLSAFAEASFDLVFGVETVCYSENKERVIAQVSRVLKPGGKVIFFDGYEVRPQEDMTAFERRVSAICFAAMCVTSRDQYIGSIRQYLEANRFSHVEITDVTQEVRPTLRKLDSTSGYFFGHPRLIRFAKRFFPLDATLNAIAGWLMLLTFDGIHRYYRVVAEKQA